MFSARSLIQLPVMMEDETHQPVAIVKDVCLNPSEGRLCGLIVSTPRLLRSQNLLYWQDILRFDRTAVWIDTMDMLREIDEAADSWWFADRTPGIWGRTVQNNDGRTVGVIGDVLIDERGRIVGCTISDGLVKDFLDGQQTYMSTVSLSEDGGALMLASEGHIS